MSVTHLQSTEGFEPGLPRGFPPRGFRVLSVNIYSQLSCRAVRQSQRWRSHCSLGKYYRTRLRQNRLKRIAERF